LKNIEKFYSNGKLLLTGEYLVLDGAKAIALPCKPGQSLKVEKTSKSKNVWLSYLSNGELWQKTRFSIEDIADQKHQNDFEKRLFQILKVVQDSNPELFNDHYRFTTQLDFEKEWGLGSSSTLINNISKWSKIDPYDLLDKTFGGSGYDIAAANMTSPFFYTRKDRTVETQNIKLNDDIKSRIYFVYLNKKQNSREGIARYREKTIDSKTIEDISSISEEISKVKDIVSFEKLLKAHEDIVSQIIDVQPIESSLFKGYKSGVVKSLGAWGGDFVMVTASNRKDLNHFEQMGYNVIFNYKDLVF
jgi:mevalonate kinase